MVGALYKTEFSNYTVILTELKIYFKRLLEKNNINECLSMWESICRIITSLYCDYV